MTAPILCHVSPSGTIVAVPRDLDGDAYLAYVEREGLRTRLQCPHDGRPLRPGADGGTGVVIMLCAGGHRFEQMIVRDGSVWREV